MIQRSQIPHKLTTIQELIQFTEQRLGSTRLHRETIRATPAATARITTTGPAVTQLHRFKTYRGRKRHRPELTLSNSMRRSGVTFLSPSSSLHTRAEFPRAHSARDKPSAIGNRIPFSHRTVARLIESPRRDWWFAALR